ncbi:MAG: mreC [Acidimicrobiales bacterium]|nr:mreC [Acidimicrobiales bacterium]
MAYSRRTGRSRFTLFLLVLSSLTLLAVDLPGTGPLKPVRRAFGVVFSPFRSAGNSVFKPVADGWHGMFGYGDLKKENARLRSQLEKNTSDQARLKQLQLQNDELRKIAGVKAGTDQTVTAQVTSGRLSSFDRTIEIDQGSGQGIKKGMAVITEGGLIGKVSRVSGGSSTVTLLTEPTFDVGVKVPRTQDQGIAHGQGQGRPLLIEDGIPAKAQVKRGDDIFTSGTDRSFYPPGLLIGKVTKVATSSDGTALVVTVEPSADLSSISYVKVVLREPPA